MRKLVKSKRWKMKMKFPIIKARDLSKHQNITDCYHDISIQINRDLPGSKSLDPIVKPYKASMNFNLCYPSMGYQTISCISIWTNNPKFWFHLYKYDISDSELNMELINWVGWGILINAPKISSPRTMKRQTCLLKDVHSKRKIFIYYFFKPHTPLLPHVLLNTFH